MRFFEFYFDAKAGLRSPSKTLALFSTITCWAANIVGVIAAIVSMFMSVKMGWNEARIPGLLGGLIGGGIVAILYLLLFKFLGWLSAFGLTRASIALAAFEKILNTDFAAVKAPAETEEQTVEKQYLPWDCRHCGTSNSGYMNFCIKCSKLKDE